MHSLMFIRRRVFLGTSPSVMGRQCTGEIPGARENQKELPGTRRLTRGVKTGSLWGGPMSPPKPSLDDLRIERSNKPESKRWSWPILLLLLVLGFAGAGFWWISRPRAVEVRTIVARETGTSGGGSERTVLNASGYVTARRDATVSSKVTGKVIEVRIEEGMKVQEGQILARLDDTNVKAALRLAEAQLDSAKAALAETRV